MHRAATHLGLSERPGNLALGRSGIRRFFAAICCLDRRAFRQFATEKLDPVDIAILAHPGMDLRGRQRHLFDGIASAEQIGRRDRNIQLFEREQRRTAVLLDVQLLDAKRAGYFQRRRFLRLLAENRGQLRVELSGQHLDRQFDRRVVKEAIQFQVGQIERHLALERLRKRLAPALDDQRRAVERRRERRLDEDFGRVGETGDERQAEVDITDEMFFPD